MVNIDDFIHTIALNPLQIDEDELDNLILNFDSRNDVNSQKLFFVIKSIFDLSLHFKTNIVLDMLIPAIYSNPDLHFLFHEIQTSDLKKAFEMAKDEETLRIINCFIPDSEF